MHRIALTAPGPESAEPVRRVRASGVLWPDPDPVPPIQITTGALAQPSALLHPSDAASECRCAHWHGPAVVSSIERSPSPPRHLAAQRQRAAQRRHASQSLPGMIRFMNSSNNGTVKAVSPWLGLQIMPLVINPLLVGPNPVTCRPRRAAMSPER